jgi:hypothetical protein
MRRYCREKGYRSSGFAALLHIYIGFANMIMDKTAA